MIEPTLTNYDKRYSTLTLDLRDPKLLTFIDALINPKRIKFQNKVYIVRRILLTEPSIIILKEV